MKQKLSKCTVLPPLVVALIVFLLVLSGNVVASDFGNIVFVGDSITEASSTRPTHGDGDYSWRYELWKKIIDNGDTYQFVGSRTSNAHGSTSYPTYLGQAFPNRHESKWGTWSQERHNTLAPYWGDLNRNGSNFAADIAFIFVGGNDSLTVSQVSGYLGGMVDALQSANPDVSVYLLSIIPRYTSDTDADGFKDLPDARNATQYTDINTNLEAFETSKSTDNSTVTYIDLFSLVQPNWLFDGIHPNANGELQIAAVIYDAMTDTGVIPSQAGTIVNVDFNQGSSGNYSGQGAYADPGNDVWNHLAVSGGVGSGVDLTASDGTATTIDVTANGTGQHQRSGYSNTLLRDGSVHVTSIEIEGLNDNMTYDLTFYSTFDTFATTFTVDGQSAGVSGSPDEAPYQEDFVDRETYVTLYGINTNGAGSISVAVTNTHTGAGGAANKTFVTGLQIAEVSKIGNPYPWSGQQDIESDYILSWTAPTEPNIVSVLDYTIYMDPNETFVADGESSLVDYFNDAISGTQAQYDPAPDLSYNTQYFWHVTAEVQYDDGSTNTVEGPVWHFTTKVFDSPPVVDAGDNILTTLELASPPNSLTLQGSVADDGASLVTIGWEAFDVTSGGDLTTKVTFTDATDPGTTVTISDTGTYILELTAADGVNPAVADQKEIVVYADPCEAAKATDDWQANAFDRNEDCIVNMEDFALFAMEWLNSTALSESWLYSD